MSKKWISPTTVLAGILYYLNRTEFPHDQKPFHKVICDHRDEFSILEKFPCDRTGMFPWSDTVEEAFSNLFAGGSLSSLSNVKGSKYVKDPSLNTYFRGRIREKEFTNEQLADLSRIAVLVEKELDK